MSYRNDHDAALARIEDLEQELDRLKAAPVPPPPPRVRSRATLAYIAAAAVCAGGIGAIAHYRHDRDTTRVDHAGAAIAVAPAVSLDALGPCVAAVRAARAGDLSAKTTDPRGFHRSIDAIAATGATCRHELAVLAHDPTLAAQQREALARWLVSEDELAGDLSRMAVYYANDPYALDGYSTAAQLWTEYRDDLAARDAVLPAVVRALELPNV